jgi:hypothetical protein
LTGGKGRKHINKIAFPATMDIEYIILKAESEIIQEGKFKPGSHTIFYTLFLKQMAGRIKAIESYEDIDKLAAHLANDFSDRKSNPRNSLRLIFDRPPDYPEEIIQGEYAPTNMIHYVSFPLDCQLKLEKALIARLYELSLNHPNER